MQAGQIVSTLVDPGRAMAALVSMTVDVRLVTNTAVCRQDTEVSEAV